MSGKLKTIFAISGAHSQGKTTLIGDLRSRQTCDTFYKLDYVDSVTRNIMVGGLPINELGIAETQIRVMNAHREVIESADSNDNALLIDRCALDGLAYSMYFKDKMNAAQWSWIVSVFETLMPYYTKVFYITPELPLVDDSVRSVNVDFSNKIQENFAKVIKEYNINVIEINGSRDDRVSILQQSINSTYNTYHE